MPFAKILLLYAVNKSDKNGNPLTALMLHLFIDIDVGTKNGKIWLFGMRNKNKGNGLSNACMTEIFLAIVSFYTKLCTIVFIYFLYPRRELLISHITIIISWYIMSLSDRYNISQFICNDYKMKSRYHCAGSKYEGYLITWNCSETISFCS